MHKKYKPRGVKFVALSQDPVKEVKHALRKHQDQGTLLFATESGEASKNYLLEFGVSSVPHCFVVDKETNIHWHGHPTTMDGVLNALV